MSAHKKNNRLIHEKSPYLLQHAYNPVDWFPWGEEAFDKAKKENKPVFVSIGYSTCHWCHVMERESFEDEEIAEILNERFISIKVDREERPDIDSIYMLVTQMMTGHGGWPMSVFITPDQRVPFYAGTYFPKESRYGRPGFKEILFYLSEQFQKDPEKITSVVGQVKEALQSTKMEESNNQASLEAVENAYRHYKQTFDKVYGGFGDAPKFPIPHSLTFLLRYHHYYQNENALQMVEKTLDGLARGGIYDHIGYGFSRYSVDEKFLVPHFEKMLYDNALLAITYTEAYQITKKGIYRKITEEIFAYLLRDMQHPEGVFYSAEDADSEGEEGKFYVWSPDEVKQVVGEQLGEIYCEIYDITKQGNFEGKNIPNLIQEDIETFAKRRGIHFEQLQKELESARKALFLYREKRVRPFRDDKILSAWNGLLIAALAKAARVLGNETYLKEAERAVQFIEKHLVQNNRLMVRYREGEVKQKAFIDDYAFLLWGYLELFEAGQEVKYLKKARAFADQMVNYFWDKEEGGFFFSGNDQEILLVRQKESYDGALPSGNNVAAMQFVRLAKLTGDYTYEEKVEKIYQTFGKEINDYPNGHTMLLHSFITTQFPMKEVVVLLGDEGRNTEIENFVKKLQQGFYPDLTLLVGTKKELAEVADFTKDYHLLNDAATIYVCENFQCNQPTNDVKLAMKMLEN